MIAETFHALVVRASGAEFSMAIEDRRLEDLPAGDVLIRVSHSSINYKDALSATGNRGVTRDYPHTPGIDAAGEVVSSVSDAFQPGDSVAVMGYDLGMNTPGGWGQLIRVPADWVIALPTGLSARDAMAFGTAGMTAASSVMALQDGGVVPESGPVLVTGATGGVGTLAVMILAELGYEVVAASGKTDRFPLLKELGASEVIGREDVLAASDRSMLKARWSGVIDTVAGAYLDSALRATRAAGVVTTCGMIASVRLETSIFPFILRGIRLQGIDQQSASPACKRDVLTKLAEAWKPAGLEAMVHTCSLGHVPEQVAAMLSGRHSGRTVIVLP
ncbi:MAG: YhdH/YhfP family quinone oxidoreductase [Lentisphaerae bacterium]|jgi:acrylyl-CoA reductase (NADPH)|nr:YhdH/YhfP family quinone oxidoreductase [Lentisphaerota bacterium]MBT4819773.1 YhdH/YhfP family quinone oxidoreductase [Lentisphaerota bacterium]MBT5612152.1 YhdH/YhfP family quinone oxidoreductase [Lentisphaerota bacterium]MBT7058749.1 YhdH/YhfP family quinone oxidoreductase [Lentisphaerota bacterium]